MATGWPMKVNYANGDVYSASDVNDTNGTLNLLGSSVAYAAGKNKIINGAFNVWQRGTTVTASVSVDTFIADRFYANRNGTGATVTISQQTFTPGTAPVSGYESQYFYRFAQTVAGTTGTFNIVLAQKIEDVRTFAGQTVTMSFWAKADASRVVTLEPYQSFGSGGSGAVFLTTQSVTLTTSWARYSLTFAIPSVSGKTIGAGSFFAFSALGAVNTAQTLDFWGVQVEQGSTATAFQTATGTIQGELAACQRYYYRVTPGASNESFCIGQSFLSTNAVALMAFPVTMRIAPTSLEQSGTASHYAITDSGMTARACTAVPTLESTTTDSVGMLYITATNMVAGYATIFKTNNSAGYIGWSAEL